MLLRLSLIAFTLITFGACRSTPTNSGSKDTTTVDTSSAMTSAISGLVLKGPLSPVQRPGDPNEGPLPGAHILISYNLPAPYGTAAIAANVISDSNGRFFVKLAVGSYRISPQGFPNSPLPRPEDPTVITLPTNTVVYDTVHYDTGIR